MWEAACSPFLRAFPRWAIGSVASCSRNELVAFGNSLSEASLSLLTLALPAVSPLLCFGFGVIGVALILTSMLQFRLQFLDFPLQRLNFLLQLASANGVLLKLSLCSFQLLAAFLCVGLGFGHRLLGLGEPALSQGVFRGCFFGACL